MTDPSWLDLGPLADFPEGSPVLRKAGGQRFACVKAEGGVHAIDDRCPHQGYPLSQGSCKDGVLTCEWHNWKFDLATGENTFGGEAVRRYPTRIEDGRVHLNPAIDGAKEAERLRTGLLAALKRDEMSRALREALRLGQFTNHPRAGLLGPLASGFEMVAHDGAQRAEYGFDHGLAVLADLMTWAERGWIGKDEAFVAGAHAVAEASRFLPARAVHPASDALPDALDPLRASNALTDERREEAEARIRTIARARGGEKAAAAVVPFLARHLYEYGHGAIFVAKSAEIAARFPSITEDIFGAVAVTLAWATAETSLPPFTATRAALQKVDSLSFRAQGTIDWDPKDRAAYETDVLAGETSAVESTHRWLAKGLDPKVLLRAVARAAAERLARFDNAWEERVDAEVGALDVTHTVTFAESALVLADAADPHQAARFAVMGAGFVGKVRNGDRKDHEAPAPFSKAPDLASAARARDAGRAIAIAREMSASERRAAYEQLAPFAAFDAAVRPIFYAHTVKNSEALFRLDRDDSEASPTYLTALVSYIVPTRREWRPRRVAGVASKFLEDGRPPEGIY